MERLSAMPRKCLKLRGLVSLWEEHYGEVGAFSFSLGFTISAVCMFLIFWASEVDQLDQHFPVSPQDVNRCYGKKGSVNQYFPNHWY